MAQPDAKSKIQVVIKSRPLIKREKDARQTSQWKINGDSIECISAQVNFARYTFDKIYADESTNKALYEKEVQPIVEQFVKGFNGTVFAYGQTSSGKTFTMLGDKKNPGVIRLAARQIFSEISKAQDGCSFVIRVNYLEIYNEKVYDLLNDRSELKIKELPGGDVNVGDGQLVRSEDEIINLVDNGNVFRKVAETNMNVQSSRSHAILQIGIQSLLGDDDPALVSKLNLVDLAGSERAEHTGATGDRLKEAGNINKSLLTLSIVINKLSEEPDGYIGYRDSKLTRMLQNSLGGNSMTAIICAITPAAIEETNLTLGFATRAKKIENKPVVNEVVSDAIEVKRMKKKIGSLEKQLEAQKKQMEEFEKIKKELQTLKLCRIKVSRNVPISGIQRRKTWGGDCQSTQAVDMEMPKKTDFLDIPTSDQVNGRSKEMQLLSGRGCGGFDSFGPDFDENEWQNSSQMMFTMPIIDEVDEEKTPQSINKPSSKVRRSLLKTPTSVKNLLNRGKDLTPTTSSTVASPIALDKDKRIKSLEAELEELRHFKQIESMVDTSRSETLQADLDQKSAEIARLSEDLDGARKRVTDMEAKLEATERELKDANRERSFAVQAQALAEQKMTSIEYEYEQHQARTTRREKELVGQLEILGNDEEVKQLKVQLNTMKDKVISMEAQLWQEEKKHQSEIDALNLKIQERHDEYQRACEQVAKFKSLQSEYDEVSMQVVDCIQENDILKGERDTLSATIDKLNKKIGELESQISEQASFKNITPDLDAKLQTQIKAHESEMEILVEKHRQDLEEQEKRFADQMASIKNLKETLFEKDDEINKIKYEYDDLLSYCNQLEHNNNIQQNACIQSKLTVDCVLKETDVLRRAFTDIQMETAKGELEHLKLQKTICEYNDTINGSLLDETGSISLANLTQQMANSDYGKKDASISNDLLVQLQKANEERISNAYQLDSIKKRLLSVAEQEEATSQQDIDQILDQMLTIFKVFNRIKQILTENRINEQNNSIDHHSVVEIIRSCYESKAEIEHKNISMSTDLKTFKEKCNLLQSAQQKDKELIATLENETQMLSDQLQLLQSEEKRLKEQIKTEKSTNAELYQKLMAQEDHEKLLDQQTEELSDIKSKQRAEITRLQQMVSENSSASTELTKLNREIDEVSEKWRKALAECQEMNALLSDKEKLVNEKELQLTELSKQVCELKNTIETNKTELDTLYQQNSGMIGMQKDNAMQIESLQDEIASLKDTLAQNEQKMIAQFTQKGEDVKQLIEVFTQKLEKLHIATSEIAHLKQTLGDFEHDKTEDQGRVNELLFLVGKQLEKKIEQLGDATSEITCLKQTLAECKRTEIEYQEKINDLELKNAQQLREKQNQFETATSEIIHLKETLTDFECNKGELETRFDKRCVEMAEQIKKKDEQLGDASSEITCLKQTLAECKRTEIEYQEKINDLQFKTAQQLREKQNQFETATSEISRLQATIQDLEHFKSDAQEKLDQLRLKNDGQYKKKEEELKQATLNIAELQEIIDSRKRTDMENQRNSDELVQEIKMQLMQKEGELQNARRIIDDLTEAARNVDRHKEDIQKRSNELQNEMNQKERQLKDAQSEIVELKEVVGNYERMNKLNQSKLNEVQDKISALEEEQETLEALNRQHEFKIKSQKSEIDDLRKNLEQVGQQLVAIKKSKDKLESDNQQMANELNAIQSKRHSALGGLSTPNARQVQSPKHRDKPVDIDSLLNENKTLKSMQKQLEDEVDDLRKSTSQVRKIKRRSIHDDTRRISGFDATMIDIETQTDPASEMCGCNEKSKQITKLKQDLVIIEARYATFRLSTGVDQLIAEVKTLKSDLSTAKSKLNRMNIDHESLQDKYEELKVKMAIKLQKPATNDASVQPDGQLTGATFVEQMNWERLNQRAEKYKKAYGEILTNFNQLKATYDQLKSGQKSSSAAGETADNSLLKMEYEQLKLDHEKSMKKHLEAAEFVDKFKAKYEATKNICNSRLEQIHEFKQTIDNFERTEKNLKVELQTLKSELKKVTESNKNTAVANKIQFEQMKSEYDAQKKKLRDTTEMLDELKLKYSNMKAICNSRYDRLIQYEESEKNSKSEIAALTGQYKEVKQEADRLKRKYETAKVMLESRRQEILKLMGQNNENVPINNK